MVQTMVEQLCPCSPWRTFEVQRSTCSRWMLKGAVIRWEVHDEAGYWQGPAAHGLRSRCWSRFPWWDLWPCGGPTLEQLVCEGLHHTEKWPTGQQFVKNLPMGWTHARGVGAGLYPMGRTPQGARIKSLILRLQRLQEKAIEEDDYDRADKFRRKLEELEKEKNSLKFQLPSRHPSVSSFLDRFITQVQAALCWAADRRVRCEENDLCHEKERKLLRTTYQERMQVSATKRNQLSEEKKRLQKEIEDLRTRLTVLEEKDQQLRREMEEQDRLIQSQDCELAALLGCVSLRELQEISKAVDDTLGSSYQIPFSLDLPGTIKRRDCFVQVFLIFKIYVHMKFPVKLEVGKLCEITDPSISWVKNFAFSVMELAYIEFENVESFAQVSVQEQSP
ncbi:hypothetical protein WISP_70135 [Willisornis vidua]|uniref:UVR domain-containing protein n=1 Tax=Willisornis vidua TaxID=1566151 RepID=A0ABQ9DDD8_9PASS|nr:hypothetical protein WISP_70135 [Willisornis vidua]